MADDYTQLITSQHRNKPKFSAMVGLLAGAFGQITDSLLAQVPAFDVDLAVGAQLDAVGRWVGVTRYQLTPIEDVFFAWNDPALGWNFASWKGQFEASQGVTTLDDQTYRATIKAKIAGNYWDGTNASLVTINSTTLEGFNTACFVTDNLDMSVAVYIVGTPSAVLLQMVMRGITPPKPAGVRVAGYFTPSTPGAPFFALSVPTGPLVAGLDFGSF